MLRLGLGRLHLLGELIFFVAQLPDFVAQPQQFFIFLFAMLQLMSPLKSLSNVNATLQEGLAAAVRIFRILDTKPAIVSRPAARPVSTILNGIEFDRVGFR